MIKPDLIYRVTADLLPLCVVFIAKLSDKSLLFGCRMQRLYAAAVVFVSHRIHASPLVCCLVIEVVGRQFLLLAFLHLFRFAKQKLKRFLFACNNCIAYEETPRLIWKWMSGIYSFTSPTDI